MATHRIETYDESGLLQVEEIEVPDEEVPVTGDPAVEKLLEELGSVSTQSAKINAIQRYFERVAGLRE